MIIIFRVDWKPNGFTSIFGYPIKLKKQILEFHRYRRGSEQDSSIQTKVCSIDWNGSHLNFGNINHIPHTSLDWLELKLIDVRFGLTPYGESELVPLVSKIITTVGQNESRKDGVITSSWLDVHGADHKGEPTYRKKLSFKSRPTLMVWGSLILYYGQLGLSCVFFCWKGLCSLHLQKLLVILCYHK